MIMTKNWKVLTLVLSLTALAACNALDELLEVDAPSQVVASDLENPAAAGLMVASVENEFRCAFSYFGAASALTGNEWRDVSNNTVLNIWDQRVHDTSGYGSQYASADCGSTQPAIYQPLSRSRWMADFTLGLLDGWDVADVPDDAFNLAVQRFDDAIAAGASGDVLNAVRVGKARAQLDLGQAAAAATTAGAVPQGFAYEMQYSNDSNETRNVQWNISIDDENVSPAEPYRDFQYGGVLDSRVTTYFTSNLHPTTGLEIWNSDKYPDADSPIELASYEEAQLIVAESLVASDPDAAVAIIDALHAAVSPALPAYGAEGEQTGPADPTEVMEHLVLHERAAELFLEGQHLYDLTRYSDIIDLFPAVGVDDGFGGQYGDQICFDLPATEFQNNTTLVGG
jgi:hypothetical protein